MIDVVRLLNSVGKKIFVEYYDDFKNVTDKKAPLKSYYKRTRMHPVLGDS